jgi:hypothetical protein
VPGVGIWEELDEREKSGLVLINLGIIFTAGFRIKVGDQK